jgi:DNA-binding NarL/FixJ family response regulator
LSDILKPVQPIPGKPGRDGWLVGEWLAVDSREDAMMESGQTAVVAHGASRDGGIVVRLTPAQIKVMRGVQSGRLNKQIAYDLGIAEATVKAHMTALMRKLNVRNRTQVAIAAESLALHVA